MGDRYRYYRIFYALFFTAGLLSIAAYLFIRKENWIYPRNLITVYGGIILGTWGIIIIRKAFREYSLNEFIGVSYMKEAGYQPSFKTTGILSYIRHPLYAATLLLVYGFFLFLPTLSNLISVLCLTAYIFIGIRLEEKKLKIQFGEKYKTYCKNVPMILPRIRVNVKKGDIS